MGRPWRALVMFLLMFGAARAQAALKVYDSTPPNGQPGDSISQSFNPYVCPPVLTTLATVGRLRGQASLVDDGSGTVTLEELWILTQNVVDLDLTEILGPGAFVFADNRTMTEIVAPHAGIGASAPGGQISWGVISGWVGSSSAFCVSSPTSFCTSFVCSHEGCGFIPPPFVVPSATYDLGTWNFDAEGDFEAAQPYLFRTSTGGLTNNQRLLRGAFVGASVPALPLLGSALLVLGLLVVARRARC